MPLNLLQCTVQYSPLLTTVWLQISVVSRLRNLAIKGIKGNSLVVWWLGLHTSTAGGTGLIPGGGTKILQTAWCGKNNKTKTNKQKLLKGIKAMYTANVAIDVDIIIDRHGFRHRWYIELHLRYLFWFLWKM